MNQNMIKIKNCSLILKNQNGIIFKKYPFHHIKKNVQLLTQKKIHKNLKKQINKITFFLQHKYYEQLTLNAIFFKCGFTDSKSKIWLELGYSHRILVTIPSNISIKCTKRDILIIGYEYKIIQKFKTQLKFLRIPDIYRKRGIQ